MKYLLGIDVGTTGTKSLLFSEEGKLLAFAGISEEKLPKLIPSG